MKIEVGDTVICKTMKKFDSGLDLPTSKASLDNELTEQFKGSVLKVVSTKSEHVYLPIMCVIQGGDIDRASDVFFFDKEDIKVVGVYKTELYKALEGELE